MTWKRLRKSPLAMRRDRGFTLIELMVAVAAFSIVCLAAFAVLDSGQRNALMNDQTVKVQQNVRLAMDLISRDIRMTGYGNPVAGSLGVACPNHLNATDNAVGVDTGPDSISIMTLNQEIGQLSNNIPTLVPGEMPMQNLLLGWGPGTVTLEGVYTAGATFTNLTTLTLGATLPPTVSFPKFTRVFDLACVTYTVTGAGVTPPFQLMRQVGTQAAVAIVDGIESLQFAYAVDADGNGAIDDQAGGVAGTFDCLDFVPNNGPCTDVVVRPANTGTVTAIPATMNQTPSPVRQVRITVVGRAIPPANAYVANNCWRDPTFTGASQIQAEDQLLAPASVNPVLCNLKPTDPLGIRRRALTRVVSLRETTLN